MPRLSALLYILFNIVLPTPVGVFWTLGWLNTIAETMRIPYEIQFAHGDFMLPTISPGSLVVTSTRLEESKHGDIVSFRCWTKNVWAPHRVIELKPGEDVAVVNDRYADNQRSARLN